MLLQQLVAAVLPLCVCSLEAILDLENLSINDLIAGLADKQPDPPQVVTMWLESAGIYPGTMRVRSCQLYEEFKGWYATQPGITEKIPHVGTWGSEMTRRFKKERGRNGFRYYISRSKEPKIPKNLSSKKNK